VKQSIYRFRLAEPGRFLQRQILFREDRSSPRRGELIALQANFRSRSKLLDAINATFERLMTAEAADIEYDRTHVLRAGLTFAEPPAGSRCFPGAPIEMHLLPARFGAPGGATDHHDGGGEDADADGDLDRTEREALLVAMRIRVLVGLDGGTPYCVADKEAPGGYRPLRFGDIVILLRAMQHKSNDFANALRAHGISVHSEAKSGFFDSTEVNDVLALLRLLDNSRQDVPLATFLRSPLGRLPCGGAEDALARIRLAYPEASTAYHQAVAQYAAEQRDELATHLRGLLADLQRWRELAQRRPLAELLTSVF
jgi:ATP-dependent helicase/nuclease subunit A